MFQKWLKNKDGSYRPYGLANVADAGIAAQFSQPGDCLTKLANRNGNEFFPVPGQANYIEITENGLKCRKKPRFAIWSKTGNGSYRQIGISCEKHAHRASRSIAVGQCLTKPTTEGDTEKFLPPGQSDYYESTEKGLELRTLTVAKEAA